MIAAITSEIGSAVGKPKFHNITDNSHKKYTVIRASF
tara:strand:- start:414 stop:524 length:111 start_codon:yes stop_codon:yes gene_type:complete